MSHPSIYSDSSEDVLEPNTLDDEDEWKDVDPDHASPSFLSFGGNVRFRNLERFLEDAKKNHSVDLVDVQSRLSLDVFGMIKLINFVRAEVAQGRLRPNVMPANFLEGDRHLKPVIDDDALLYSVDEIFDVIKSQTNPLTNVPIQARMTQEEVQDMAKECNELREQVVYYRSALQKTYLENLELQERNFNEPSEQDVINGTTATSAREIENDSHYFSSYGYNDIHETMLKDHVRTDAYRDFIYENKDLFAGKVVLDVGCGTGILSLLCAKAGARKIIAVDNSSIIDKAREIVFENELGDKIHCLRGKIEEVTLPVKHVDIIVSEWMGYCLLYEAMLDSVIWARDHYLVPGGLMVPSHATLQLSLFADDEYISDKISFWKSVYGFNMSCMQARAYDDIVIRTIEADAVPSPSEKVLELPLHTVRKEDLTLSGADFLLPAEREVDQLYGFVIHFDIFFTTNQDAEIQDAKVGFTTGPSGAETHWQQGLALINTPQFRSAGLKVADQVKGSIALRKGTDNFRELEITINWQVKPAGSDNAGILAGGRQTWLMH
ncbi:MAG: hypothetical protein Q9181_002875 [Wetmoreana brouardii]